jgi:hypothetical protein
MSFELLVLDKLAVSSADLDIGSDVMVVDTINGHRLRGDDPFWLLAKNNRGDLVVVRHLAYIRLAENP